MIPDDTKTNTETCTWEKSYDREGYSRYHTSCDYRIVNGDELGDGPISLEFKYCPWCGRKLNLIVMS